MLGGKAAVGAVSQGILLAMAAVMVILGLMPFLSLVLAPAAARWMNIVFGIIYTAIMFLAIRGSWRFYIAYGVIEITLTLLIIWHAWRWPKRRTG
jgi:ABC-type Na+ efflux pump permease subunit